MRTGVGLGGQAHADRRDREDHEAYRAGVLVNSDNAVTPGNCEINHWTLSVSGVPFDALRVNGTGPTDRGIFIGLVDNAVIAPAPASVAVVGLLGLAGRRRRSRTR